MQRTLFLIPHEVFGIPVLGWGWVLAGVVIAAIGSLIWPGRDRSGDRSSGGASKISSLATWGVVALVVVAVLPRLELANPAGDPVGIPVRGYGLFLMFAAVGSVMLAAYRSEKAGFGAELIYQIAPLTLIGGLIGARLFYVVQYHRDFIRPTWWETIASAAALTQGGLVVYGSFIGGFIAATWAVRRRRFPFWSMGDVIVPCLFIGLALGRIGCLMNGCCYGGACERGLMSLEFPPGSPVYVDQMLSGRLIGMEGTPTRQRDANQRVGEMTMRVDRVDGNQLAAKAGVDVGDEITLVLRPGDPASIAANRPAEEVTPALAVIRDERVLAEWDADQLPDFAGPVYGTQLISAVTATMLLLSLLGFEKWGSKRSFYRPGFLLLAGFMAYAVLRFAMEWIRVDEAGQFGTSLSISQWVSLAVFAVCSIGFAFRLRAQPVCEVPPGRPIQPPAGVRHELSPSNDR